MVPYRTLHRYTLAEMGFGRPKATVRVADGTPGQEVQVDFGRLGLVPDPARGTRRVAQGLIFTAVYSRHMFVYPTLRQTLEEVVVGFEAAWVFFGGVFAVVVPDNMKTIVDQADAVDPRLNDAFREYAQARGFAVDPARVRHPRDKPQGGAVCAVRTVEFLCGRRLPRYHRLSRTCRGVVFGGRWDARSRHDAAAARRGVRRRGTAVVVASTGNRVRGAVLHPPQGGSRSAPID
jgi:transposase